MKILLLAPEPFFQERGTPIAVKLLCEALSKTKKYDITLLTYHEGKDINIPGVKHLRISAPGILSKLSPGISLKKIICDLIFALKALKIVYTNRKSFDLIHAVEEAVFPALLIKSFIGIPYVYDMDSAITEQTIERWKFLSPIGRLLRWLEGIAIKKAVSVIAVCPALAERAVNFGSKNTHLLLDISLLSPGSESPGTCQSLRELFNIPEDGFLTLYVGNLEQYQGIDLFLDGLKSALIKAPNIYAVIIGGSSGKIRSYSSKLRMMGLEHNVFLAGPKPLSCLAQILSQANALVSPRLHGINTPMKIYSCLHSGKPLIATNLETHTQVLNHDISLLCNPDPESLGKAIIELAGNRQLCEKLGANGRRFVEENSTAQVFTGKITNIYNEISEKIANTTC